MAGHALAQLERGGDPGRQDGAAAREDREVAGPGAEQGLGAAVVVGDGEDQAAAARPGPLRTPTRSQVSEDREADPRPVVAGR